MHSANDNTPVTSEELRVALVFLIRSFLSRLLPESLVLFPDATSAVGNVHSTGALWISPLTFSNIGNTRKCSTRNILTLFNAT